MSLGPFDIDASVIERTAQKDEGGHSWVQTGT